MVPNASFENIIGCPTGRSSIEKADGWRDYAGSVDYAHSCNNTNSSVPVNFAGYQHAADGNAYALYGALVDYHQMREAMGRSIRPLKKGVTYKVSLYYCYMEWSSAYSADIGVFFYDTGVASYNFIDAVEVTPQVNFSCSGIIADTQNWVRVEQYFYADSAYDNIAIGTFSTNKEIDTVHSGHGIGTGSIFFAIDSVAVSITDSLFLQYKDTLLCAGDTIEVPYSTNAKYGSNNTFTVQLSDAAGSFASPVNIGSRNADTSGTVTCVIPSSTAVGQSYRLRVISSNFADTSVEDCSYRSIKIGKPIANFTVNSNSPVCHNDTLRLLASTTTSGVTYKWSGPGNFESALSDPEIPFPWTTHSGGYTVTAQLYGCMETGTVTAVVDSGSGPSWVSASANSPICLNDTIKLSAASAGATTYNWSAPGNYSANQQNINILASNVNLSGNYILYGGNGTCTKRDTVNVAVKPIPANLTASYNSPLCSGSTLNLSASSSSTGVTWSWSGPNSFSSASATPFINSATAIHKGDYYVTADLNSCPLVDTVSVFIKPLPAKPVADNNSPFCAGTTLQLNTTGNSNITYSWSGPNSYSSTAQNPAISNSTTTLNGNYIITVDSNGCVNRDTTTVNIKPNPAAVTLTNNTPICAGANLQLNSTASTSGATYAWSGPNSFGANTQNTGITSANANVTGWYKLLVDLNGCTYEDSIYATVHPIPAAPVLSYNNPLCVRETLSLTANTIGGATYTWTGANGFSAATRNPTRSNMQLTDTGVYRATVTVNNCTSAADSVSVSLNPLPFVVIQSTPADSICSGTQVAFNAYPNNHGGTPAYQWFINNQSAGTGSVLSSSSLNDGDIIRCEMTENTKCSAAFTDSSNDIKMTVLPWITPSVSITASPNRPLEEDEYVTFTATAVDAGFSPDYQWKRNGADVVGATGSTWAANTLNDYDSISVEVFSNYKCPSPASAHSNGIIVKVLTGVDDIEQANDLKLYPNPNNGKFTLEAEMPGNQEATISIVNATGMQVYQSKASPVGYIIHKDINADLAPGVYMLNINTVDAQTTLRFVVLNK